MAIPLSPDQAHAAVPQDIRNAIYSALLSGDGIRNIETVLDHHLQTSGFKAALRTYITDLFRSGQATTAVEARDMAMDRIRTHMRQAAADATTSASASNSSNSNSGTGADRDRDPDLSIPQAAIAEGSKTVRAELEKIVDISYENDK